MSGEVQFALFGRDYDLIKNPKSSYLRIKHEDCKQRVNRCELKVVNHEIYQGENFQYADLIQKACSPNGVQLSREQINRLIDQEVIKVFGKDQNFDICGAYIITFKYYMQKKSAILIVKNINEKRLKVETINLQKEVKNKLDLTRYYRYVNISKNQN